MLKLVRTRFGKSCGNNRFFSANSLSEEAANSNRVKTVPAAAVPATFSESTLSNGAKVVTRQSANAAVAYLKFALTGGSRLESPAEKGAARLLSWTAFNAGSASRSGLSLMRSIETLGAVVSASADREKIVFGCEVGSENVNQVIPLLVEGIFSAPELPHVTLERQESVGLLCAPCPLMELVHEAAYGGGSALGLPSKDGANVSLADVASFRKKAFVGSNLVVSAVGGSGLHEQIVKALEVLSSNAAIPNGKAFSLPANEQKFVGGFVRQRDVDADADDISASVAFPSSANHKANSILTALLNASGAGDGVHFFSRAYSGGAAAVIGFSVSEADVSAGIASALKSIKSIASGGGDGAVLAAQVESAARAMTLEHTRALERNGSDAAQTMLAASLQGVAAKNYAASIDFRAVSAADVVAAARTLLASTPAYAVHGSDVSNAAPSFDTLKSMMSI